MKKVYLSVLILLCVLQYSCQGQKSNELHICSASVYENDTTLFSFYPMNMPLEAYKLLKKSMIDNKISMCNDVGELLPISVSIQVHNFLIDSVEIRKDYSNYNEETYKFISNFFLNKTLLELTREDLGEEVKYGDFFFRIDVCTLCQEEIEKHYRKDENYYSVLNSKAYIMSKDDPERYEKLIKMLDKLKN